MRISPLLLVIGSSAEVPDSSKIGGAIDFKCFHIGEEQPYTMVHNKLEGCAQVYDTIKTANRACSLFEQCLLVGKNSNGNFELFTESDEDTGIDLESYDLSIPTLDKTQTSLIYDFVTVLNHENMAITQITAYDPVANISVVEVPRHGSKPESTHLNFYDQNLSVVIQENTCVLQHPEQMERFTGHSAVTIDYQIEEQLGNMNVQNGEYSLSDLSLIRDDLPLIAKQQCYGKSLLGFDFDLKQVSKETDFGAKFFLMNETESFNVSNSLFRSKRIQEREKFDPVTGKNGVITYCNGVNACGDVNFVATFCGKDSCGTLFCQLLRRGNVVAPGQAPNKYLPNEPAEKAPFVSWNHIIKQGYWCMPCCILEDNVHPKMKYCGSMQTQEDICKQQYIHGRCGIDFDP